MTEIRRWTLEADDLSETVFDETVAHGPELCDGEEVEVMPVAEHEELRQRVRAVFERMIDEECYSGTLDWLGNARDEILQEKGPRPWVPTAESMAKYAQFMRDRWKAPTDGRTCETCGGHVAPGRVCCDGVTG